MKVTLKDVLKLKSKNILFVYITIFFSGMLFFLPILALYLQQKLFTLTNVSIILAITTLVGVFLEVPTGAFADIYGRKKSMLVSMIFLFLAVFMLYFGQSFFMISIYAIFIAISNAFFSGADSSLMYDTLKGERKEHYFKKVIGISSALWPLGASIGAILGGYIVSYSLDLAVILSLIPVAIGLSAVFFIKELPIKKNNSQKIHSQMWESSKFVIKNRDVLIIIIGMFILLGIGEGVHFLNSVFFQYKGVPIAFFGVLFAISSGLSAIGSYFSNEFSEKIGDKNTILLTIGISMVLIIAASLTLGYVAAFAYTASSLFFGIRNPVLSHLLNKEVPSEKRATVSSIYALVINAGIAIFSPIVGYLAQIYTINTVYFLSAFGMFAVIALFTLIKVRKK